MSETTYRYSVAISYNTRTDSDLVNALMEALASINVQGLCLPYLSVSGYGTDPPDNPQGWRKDGWVNHFMDILEQSIGMIILSTENSLPSERDPWRGIWVERNLAEKQSGAEFIFRLEHPSAVKLAPAPKPEAPCRLIEELDDLKVSTRRNYDAAEGRIAYLEDTIAEYEARLPLPSPLPPLPDPKDWARQVLPALQAWINSRQNESSPKAARFKSDLVNEKGYFDPVEVGRTFGKDLIGNDVPGTFYWYFIAVLDLYDCVWICRRCFSASDVWMRTECRPPARCPNCGYICNPVTKELYPGDPREPLICSRRPKTNGYISDRLAQPPKGLSEDPPSANTVAVRDRACDDHLEQHGLPGVFDH